MSNTLLGFTHKAMAFWRARFGPIEENTRRTAEATERIDSTRGRGSDGIRIEGDPDGEPVPVTLVDTGAGDNSVTSEQLPFTLGPGGGMAVEGVVDGIPVEVRGAVDQGLPGVMPWPVTFAGSTPTPVSIPGTVTVTGTVTVPPATVVDLLPLTAGQLPLELGPAGGLLIEGAPDGLPINLQLQPAPLVPAGYATGKLAAASITTSFLPLVTLSAPALVIVVHNGTDQRIVLSFDGATTHGYVPAFGALDLPLGPVSRSESRGVWIKHDGIACAMEAVTATVVT